MPGAFPFNLPPNPEEDDEHVPADTAELPESSLVDEPGNDNLSEIPGGPTQMGALPPEAQGETNGGPLGCCLGVTAGIMLSLFLGVIGFGHLTASGIAFLIHVDPIANIRIATGFFALVGAILGGYLGWKVGKRVYREYEPPVLKDRTRTRKRKPQPKQARL